MITTDRQTGWVKLSMICELPNVYRYMQFVHCCCCFLNNYTHKVGGVNWAIK